MQLANDVKLPPTFLFFGMLQSTAFPQNLDVVGSSSVLTCLSTITGNCAGGSRELSACPPPSDCLHKLQLTIIGGRKFCPSALHASDLRREVPTSSSKETLSVLFMLIVTFLQIMGMIGSEVSNPTL